MRFNRGLSSVLVVVLHVGCVTTADDAETFDDAADGIAFDFEEARRIPLAPEDVSALYPQMALSEMISPADIGRNGEPLLSEAMFRRIFFDELPATLRDQRHTEAIQRVFRGRVRDITAGDFRVVGVRIDPCASALPVARAQWASSRRCVRQLRLSTQLASAGREGVMFPSDYTMHLLYNISASDFSTTVRELRAMRRTLGDAPTTRLGVSQALQNATYRASMKALVLRMVSEANLVQVTASPADIQQWIFFGRIVRAYPAGRGFPAVGPISITPETQSQVVVFPGSTGFPTTPALPNPDTFNEAWYFRYLETLGPTTVGATPPPGTPQAAEIGRALAELRDLEDPRVHTPFTTDCVSCHVANHTMRREERHFREVLGTNGAPLLPPAAPNTLTRDLPADGLFPPAIGGDSSPRNFRMFGYSDRGIPSVSMRVLNETSEILAFLNPS